MGLNTLDYNKYLLTISLFSFLKKKDYTWFTWEWFPICVCGILVKYMGFVILFSYYYKAILTYFWVQSYACIV